MAGLYIHVPFCRSKCAYCDFYSGPIGQGRHQEYVDALLWEWEARKGELGGEAVQTLYLGGGTPSLLPLPLLDKLLKGLHLDFSAVSEATIEANPEDISPQWLEKVQALGINRVSIGVQSFSDKELEALGRNHRGAEALRALEILSKGGVNYSADLIYGLPGQTAGAWEENLTRLLDFKPPHFSAYLLSYEPGTRLTARMKAGKISEPSEDVAQAMYDTLCRAAAAGGYDHYEISNFGLPGRHSLHNSSYWEYTPYLGLGAAAHSFTGGVRRYNPASLSRYLEAVKRKECAMATEEETPENRINDYIITSLRTAKGMEADVLHERFDPRLVATLLLGVERLKRQGGLETTYKDFRIPEGKWLISDAIMRELIV